MRHVSKWRDWCVSGSVCKSGDSATSWHLSGWSSPFAVAAAGLSLAILSVSVYFSHLRTTSSSVSEGEFLCANLWVFMGASIWIPSAGLHGLRSGRKIFRNEKSLSLSKSLIQLNFYEILRTNWKFWQIASFMAFMPVLLWAQGLPRVLFWSLIGLPRWRVPPSQEAVPKCIKPNYQVSALSAACWVTRSNDYVTPFHCLQPLKQMYTQYAWAFAKEYKTWWNLAPGNRSSHSTGPIHNLWGNQTHCRSPGPARTAGLA